MHHVIQHTILISLNGIGTLLLLLNSPGILSIAIGIVLAFKKKRHAKTFIILGGIYLIVGWGFCTIAFN